MTNCVTYLIWVGFTHRSRTDTLEAEWTPHTAVVSNATRAAVQGGDAVRTTTPYQTCTQYYYANYVGTYSWQRRVHSVTGLR